MKLDFICRAVVIGVILLALIVSVVGTLAIPVVLAYFFSWYWILLYAAYLMVAAFLGFSVFGSSTAKPNHK